MNTIIKTKSGGKYLISETMLQVSEKLKGNPSQIDVTDIGHNSSIIIQQKRKLTIMVDAIEAFYEEEYRQA